MTALRGKSRISLPLRLQLSCAEPIFPSDAAFICKQERRVGINLRLKNIQKLLFKSRLSAKKISYLFFQVSKAQIVMQCKQKRKATTHTVSFVGFNRALISAKEDVGPETSSAKQSCFGSALSRRKACFWLLLSQPTKVTPSGADGQKPFAPFTHK